MELNLSTDGKRPNFFREIITKNPVKVFQTVIMHVCVHFLCYVCLLHNLYFLHIFQNLILLGATAIEDKLQEVKYFLLICC